MNRTPRTRTLLSLLLLLLTAGFLFVLGGCSRPEAKEEQGDAETAPAAAPADPTTVYQVRGQVVELPDPEDPLSSFYVHHEAVDDFRNMEGEIQGMDSMTMPFPVAESVTFEGVAVGDKVEMSLEVNWEGDPVIQVTRVEKLDDSTELEFRSARPAEPGASESSEHEGRGGAGDTEG